MFAKRVTVPHTKRVLLGNTFNTTIISKITIRTELVIE